MIRHASLIMALASATTAAAQPSPVEIVVSGVQPSGRVLGQVFADANTFKAREKPAAQFAIPPSGNESVRTTVALPPGRYAIALFQDTKGTGKLETGMFGRPLVPYGFSNNATGRMGPPGFDAAAFDVGHTTTTVKIELK